ncbi:hypothetical protein BGZ75_008689 [Mortierella antarctica]|nr:hypothetical protein BGZ75_008689 [Mortierella antarctica]
MTDDLPNLESVPVTDAVATDDDLAMLAEATGKVSLKGKEKEHVHDENCQHDHAREPAEPQGRNDYDLLAIRGTKDNTTDPLVRTYFEARELFTNAMERLNLIPEGSDPDLIEKHKDEIVSVTSDLMRTFLLDEKACVMNHRILKLAEQYEIYVQNGQQFQHCVQTLGFAIAEFESLRTRMLELRASSHMALRNYKACVEDLEQVLAINPNLTEIHSMLGNVNYATHQAQEAISHFRAFVEAAHPDSRTLPNAYYALATLTLQSAPSGATKKKSNQALKQAAALREAQAYYQKAKAADVRFEELYGVPTGYNEIKKTAAMAFEARSAGRNGLLSQDSTPALLEASELLKKSFKSPAISSCANCGRPDNVANEGRSSELKPKPLIKCVKCSKVAYCSRPCQIHHWNATHKNTCKK